MSKKIDYDAVLEENLDEFDAEAERFDAPDKQALKLKSETLDAEKEAAKEASKSKIKVSNETQPKRGRGRVRKYPENTQFEVLQLRLTVSEKIELDSWAKQNQISVKDALLEGFELIKVTRLPREMPEQVGTANKVHQLRLSVAEKAELKEFAEDLGMTMKAMLLECFELLKMQRGA